MIDEIDVSVIVPTRSRPDQLAHLLESLAGQTFPRERTEIIVVDDGSPDELKLDTRYFPFHARRLEQTPQGPASARNHGARRARGELLAFVDDDCVVERRWLEHLQSAAHEQADVLFAGCSCNGESTNLFSEVAEGLLVHVENAERSPEGMLTFVASNNMACSRRRFLALKGFDTQYALAAGEDRDFCRRWVAGGGRIARVTDARLLHHHVHDLGSFWRQQYNYGRGAARFHTKGQRTGTALPRTAGYYVRLMIHPLKRRSLSLPRRLMSLPLVALSQVAVAAGFYKERRDRRTGD